MKSEQQRQIIRLNCCTGAVLLSTEDTSTFVVSRMYDIIYQTRMYVDIHAKFAHVCSSGMEEAPPVKRHNGRVPVSRSTCD